MNLIFDFFVYLVLASLVIMAGGIFAVPFLIYLKKRVPECWKGMSIYKIYYWIIVISGIILLIGLFWVLISPFRKLPDKYCLSGVRVSSMCTAISAYSDRFGELTDFSHRKLLAQFAPPEPDSMKYIDIEPDEFHFLFWKWSYDFVNENGEFIDAWGKPLMIKPSASGNEVLVYSLGKNGIDENGEGDDIKNYGTYSPKSE